MFIILIEKKAREYLQKLPIKTRRIIVEKIQELQINPFSGGNEERLEYHKPHVSVSVTIYPATLLYVVISI